MADRHGRNPQVPRAEPSRSSVACASPKSRSCRELLTFLARAGSLAGLHDSTSLGDHRCSVLGVPLAGRPHDREHGPPSAALHRPAEASAADRAGGPGVLGRAAARVDKMVRDGRYREAGDGGRVAPCGLRPLLEMALQAEKTAWPDRGWPGGPRSCPEDGERERVGCPADPRRTAEAGVQGLRADRLALHATRRAFTGPEAELAHVPPEPPGGDRGHGLVHGADSDPSASFTSGSRSGTPGARSCTGASRRVPQRHG